MVHMPWGEGSVHFFASLSLFDNDHLRDEDHAEALEYLLANAKPGQATKGVLVVYGGGRRSFLAMLWDHAWYFLLAFGFLTVFWLWRVSRRFGPILEDPAWDPEGVGIGGGREFTEHIEAAARTYERRGQTKTLMQAAQERTRRMAANLPPEEFEPIENLLRSAKPFQAKVQALQVAAQHAAAAKRTKIQPLETPND
jgi:GNAT superfamily N-acetyltransferase